MSEIQQQLLIKAKNSSSNAYAPYSHFKVGAVLQTKDEQFFPGCNVENASFGLTLCAERNAISSAVAQGIKPGDIKILAIYVATDEFVSPCGACRQVIAEFMASDAEVLSFNQQGKVKSWRVDELLPDGFSLKEG